MKKYKQLPLNTDFKQTISFVTGRDCNLKCNYCYVDQNNASAMSLPMAKDIVDYVLNKKDLYSNGVIYEFIGGEPFLEIDLINDITNYIIKRQNELNHKWKNNFRISFCTNGTVFNDKVKKYLETDIQYKSVSMSLDGIREIQDLNRSNSFTSVMNNFDYWRKMFPNDIIKSTLNHEALPYMFESIRFLIDGLKSPIVMMNPVFEDVWEEKDMDIFGEQLVKIADFLIENNRYTRHHVSLFNESNLKESADIQSGWCGCGNSMMAFNYKGDIFPCVRFCTSGTDYIIGNIYNGINKNLIMPFVFNHNMNNNCSGCKLINNCPRCLSQDYENHCEIINRSAYICKMHQKKVEINKYFFNKIY